MGGRFLQYRRVINATVARRVDLWDFDRNVEIARDTSTDCHGAYWGCPGLASIPSLRDVLAVAPYCPVYSPCRMLLIHDCASVRAEALELGGGEMHPNPRRGATAWL